MRLIFVVSLLCFGSLSYPLHAQQFHWDDLHVGLSAHWMMPQGDLGKFWLNTPAAGPVLRYDINSEFSAVATIGVMYFKRAPGVNRSDIPDIFLISGTGEIQRTFAGNSSVQLAARLGLGNYRFMFRVDEFNNTESEFGLVGSLSLDFPANIFPGISLVAQYHTILASPERIGIWTAGASIFIR